MRRTGETVEITFQRRYARPIENVRVCVDLLTEEVVHVVDDEQVVAPLTKIWVTRSNLS